MRKLYRSLIAAIALGGIACTDATGPKQVPLQFESFNPGAVLEIVKITSQPASLRIVGSYSAAACGAAGAIATLDGSTVRLTVGPRRENDVCDAALVGYAYDATVLGLESGMYNVEVFHRTNGGESAKLAARDDVTVP
ncbi:MAG TPA: hypothetical protein VJL35_11900 [Gemmatimonadaceae bacterium]|nr:hypothetical protein [Gemmatimonadaceae bacterium]